MLTRSFAAVVLCLIAVALVRAGDGKADAPLVFRGVLTAKDPPDRVQRKSPHKVHEVRLEAGKMYRIDLVSPDFDPRLRIEDAQSQQLMQGDTHGKDRTAREVFTPPRSGTYRLIATASARGPVQGAYTLTLQPADERSRQEQQVVVWGVTAIQHLQRGEHEAAGRLLRQALALCQRLYSKEEYPHGHFLQANILTALGLLMRQQSKFAEAQASLEQAVAIQKKMLRPDHPDLATSLHHLGDLLRVLDKRAEARPYLEEALAIRRMALPKDDPLLAVSLNLLGVVLHTQGKLAEARGCLEEGLAIRKKVLPKDHVHLGYSLNNLGRVLVDLRKLEEARGCFEQALAIYEKALPKDSLDLAVTLANLGGLLRELGRGEEGRGYLEQALAIRRKVLPKDHPRLANDLNNLGNLLRELGKLEEARPCLEEALAIRKKVLPRDHPHLALSLNNLGALLMQLGKLEEARPYLEEALALRQKAHPKDHSDQATTLTNLGRLLHQLGKLEEARGYYEQALAIFQKGLPKDDAHLATCLSNLGTLLHDLGMLTEAQAHHKQALAIRQKALPKDHPDLALSLNNLATVLRDLRQVEEARRSFEQALVIYKKALPADHPLLAITLFNLGCLLTSAGRCDDAWPLLSDAVAASSGYHRRLATATAQRDHPDLLRTQRRYLDYLLSAAAAADALAAHQRENLLLRVLEGKGISTAALGSRRQALLRQADPGARALADQLVPLQRRLADLLLQGPGKLSPQQYRDECLDLQGQIDALERALGQRLQAFALLQKAHTAAPADLVQRLPAGTVLVETVRYPVWTWNADPAKERWGPPRYAAVLLWAEAAGPQVRLVDLGAAAPLERAIAAWRQQVQRGETDRHGPEDEVALLGAVRKGEFGKAPGLTLRTLLWQPLAKVLPQGTDRLVIAPDGELALVPFEALRLADGKYLVEALKISYVSSGRDLMPQPQPKDSSAVSLVLADPAYDALGKPASGAARGLRAGVDLPKGLRFRSLPGFAREADAVAQLLKKQGSWQVAVRRGEAASEEALAALARPRLLYCVTHGFFLKNIERSPEVLGLRDLKMVSAGGVQPALPRFGADPRLRSGLALTGANRWQERSAKGLSDGLLTALEVEQLDLWGTELVVLSACETGLGELQVGEGVLGLRRAFQLAGAQTVVASLWKVPDVETEQLMTAFLGRWLQGQGKAEALREAQLEMIRRLRAEPNARRRQAPPLFWAGFICHGQPR
jgi:tetratricopeptide (TPR) repeat protein/CHAT domain-containing protein